MNEIARFAARSLGPGEMKRLEHPPYDILVANVAGRFLAIEDACPHSGQSLCTGSLRDEVVTCPGHGWRVDLESGAVLTGAGAGLSNPVYPVRVEGDDVVVYSASSSPRS